jgi:hypothetical protein
LARLLFCHAGEDIEILKILLKKIPVKIENKRIDHGSVLLAFFFLMDESGAGWVEKKYLPVHAGKGQFMAPGGRLMAENDTSWVFSGDF